MAVTPTEVRHSGEDDDKLMEVAMLCLSTGDMTPLIKEELKYTIQSRRMQEGKNELEVRFAAPIQSELTADELLRRDTRREQNRVAARKFRQKQVTSTADLVKELQELQTENTRLKTECDRLSRVKERWRGKLEAMIYSCREDEVFRDS